MTTDNFCFYLQYRPIQTSQTGGQPYSDTSPFSIPWPLLLKAPNLKGSFTFATFGCENAQSNGCDVTYLKAFLGGTEQIGFVHRQT
jgi:hypothetical protein